MGRGFRYAPIHCSGGRNYFKLISRIKILRKAGGSISTSPNRSTSINELKISSRNPEFNRVG